MSKKCIKEMLARAKKADIELTEREAGEIFRRINNEKVQGERLPFEKGREELRTMTPEDRISVFAREAFAKLTQQKEEAFRRRILQVQKSAAVNEKVANLPTKTHVKALNEVIFATDRRKEAIVALDMAEMSDALEAYNKTLGFRITRGDAINVVREIGEPGSTGDANARKLAEVWTKGRTEARARKNAAGADIGLLSDWIMPQAWDQAVLRRVGQTRFVDEAMKHINRERYFDDATGKQMNDEQIRALITEAHETIVTDGLNKPLLGTGGRPTGLGSLGKRLSEKQRSLHFKDADAWLAMSEAFGEKDIFTLMTQTITKDARDVSMLEAMGPNPKATFEGGLALAQHLDKSDKGAWMSRNYFDELTGSNNIPANTLLANSMQGLRQWLVATKLGSLLLSQANDAGVYAVMARSDGMGMGKAMRLAAKSLNPLSKQDQLIARRHAVLSQSIVNDVAMRYGETVKGHTLTSRFANATVKLSGGQWWTDGMKRAYQSLIGTHLNDFTGTDFAKIEPDFKKLLERYEIDKADWELIRKTPPVEILGEQVITPTAVKLAGEGTDTARETALKVAAMMAAEADVAVPTPGLRERAIIRGGTKAGTVQGEAIRSMALFKSFSVTMVTKVLPRVFNAETLKTAKGASLAAQFAVSMMVLGGLSLQLKEIAKGRNPQDITTPGFWGKAMAQSGGLGIFGDFLSADTNRFGGGLPSTIAGPVAGLIEDVSKLTIGNLKQIAVGEETRIGPELVRTAGGNIPVVNLWYTKAAINHLLIQQAQDMLNPGYSRRIRNRSRKQYNQGEWWPTGKMLPESAPKLEEAVGGRR